jgi:hypothetical protein
MVRSEVALWPLNEVGTVDDLRAMMESLGSPGPIQSPSPELLGAVAEVLLSAAERRPPVVQDLDAWPGIIAALWTRLWPEARQAFSARVAISPPQGGESVAPPWLYAVPSERAPQWAGHQLISTAPSPARLSRGARWLMGELDPTLNEVLSTCPSLPPQLGGLRLAVRGAERLERLRQTPTPQHALDLLRTLVVLAPAPNSGEALKREALKILRLGLLEESPTLVLSLANLDPAELPAGELPEAELEAWTSRRIPDLPLDHASTLLKTLSPVRAKHWWQQAVQRSLSAAFANPEPRWAKVALRWLGLPDSAEALFSLLPATESIEQRLIDATSDVEMAEDALRRIQQQATERRWSRLHAWAVMHVLSPREAFRAQRAFPGNPIPGLALLVERVAGAAIVEEAITRPDAQLIRLVAQRTARQPELLRPLDASHSAWRKLWAAHVAAGGSPWPPSASSEVLGRALLDAVLAGDEPEGLIATVAEDLANIAFVHPERAALWERLSPPACNALLGRVAEAVVQACEQGQPVPTPEPQLATRVLERARKASPSARLLATLLQWNVRLDEQEAIHWLNGPKHSDLVPVARAVGQAILARGWERAAKAIYTRWKGVTELRPAVEACQDLLSSFERWMLSLFGTSKRSIGQDDIPLMHRVAELGANLAPDRLDDIWERAGGERKHLNSSGSPDIRWREAATMASKGALEGGLLALVRELKKDLPYNNDLQELEKFLLGLQAHKP